MNPILFASTETKFDTNGLGVLSDAISCIVTEERNGSFELVMRYSVDGIHFEDITDRSIILAKPSPTDNPQPFRVYRHTKPLNGIVAFYARHISYDLSGIPVSPFSASDVLDAFNKLKANAVIPCPFDFWTDKVTVASMNVRVPSSIYPLLGGQEGSVLDRYGGEYKFDGYTVRLYNERGTDRGVSIRYGKNLLDLEQERNCANVCTGVYPYWADSNGENLVQLEDKIVNAPGTYDFARIKMLDLSSEWDEAPSTEQLKARAESYIKENNIGVPTVSLTVTHAMFENTEEYKGQALLERIDLCDTALVEFPKLGVSASAKAVKTEFNALLDRYESITFGDARYTLADSIVEQQKGLSNESKRASGLVADAMKKLNELVQNSSGLYTTEELQPDRSVIYYYHDKPNLTDSKNVIKFTADAIGLSTDGGKTYPFGFTVTGDMVANILSAIGVNANWINAGILQSLPDENGERNFTFNLQSGDASVKNLSIHGQTADEIASEKADSALKDAQGYADSAVNNFVSSVYDPKIDELQKQIDGQIESYFYDYEPKLDNVPASDWATEDEKKKHEGDLFYWKSKGYAYRFFKDGETWKWQLVQDTDVTKALQEAANAQHTADGKSRTFISEPVPPYDVGDQWYRGENSTLVCTNSRNGGAFDMSDWDKLDNYADGKETIYSVQSQYYLSSSSTSLKDGEWSNTQPTWTQGKYIWSRQYVTYGDGHHAYTPSETGVCITGNTGAKGDDGRGIKSTSITYKKSTSGTVAPSGTWENDIPPVSAGEYLWTKIVYTYTDGTTDTAYSVSMMGQTGLQGLQGPKGDQGLPGPKGDTGAMGPQGATGEQGTQGINLLTGTKDFSGTWVKLSDFWTKEENYNGFTVYSRSAEWSGIYQPYDVKSGEKYTFSLFAKVDEGLTLPAVFFTEDGPGETNPNMLAAQVTTEWNRYSISFEITKDGLIAPRLELQTAGTKLYVFGLKLEAGFVDTPVWTPAPQDLVGPQGEKGETGAQGPAGPAGQTSYFHIKYSSNPNPTVADEMTETPSEYIGTYVDFIEADSDDPGRYKWSRFQGLQGEQGTQGIPGTNGTNGQTSYLHIKYSNDGGTTFTDNSGETVGDYIGQLVNFTKDDSTNPNDYTWSKIKGDKGDTGANGKDGEPGTNGEDGVGISSIVTEYRVSPSNEYPDADPMSKWQADMPMIPESYYLWTRQVITYSDSPDHVEYTGVYCLTKAMTDALTDIDIMNKLTDNGRRKGIFFKDNDLYVSASAIITGVLDAAKIAIAGDYGSILQGKGSTIVNGETMPTTGLLAMGPKRTDGAYSALMLSDVGARLSSKNGTGGTSIYVIDGYITTQNGVLRVEDAIAMALPGESSNYLPALKLTTDPSFPGKKVLQVGNSALFGTEIYSGGRLALDADILVFNGPVRGGLNQVLTASDMDGFQGTDPAWAIYNGAYLICCTTTQGALTSVVVPANVVSAENTSKQNPGIIRMNSGSETVTIGIYRVADYLCITNISGGNLLAVYGIL